MNEEELKEQINSLIRDEIQDVINDYVDEKDKQSQSGLGFVRSDEEKQLKINVSQNEIDKIIKEYKKIKKSERSNISHIKKLGLVDKHGNPLK
jgi:hypothetical protein|tara:strand:+ start:680 stop:958 length:279 start_codon:yes stop_codon:yes gene_type:complete